MRDELGWRRYWSWSSGWKGWRRRRVGEWTTFCFVELVRILGKMPDSAVRTMLRRMLEMMLRILLARLSS